MTTLEVVYRYEAPATEQAALALARARDVYGIRYIALDREAHTVRVEYDATRLNAAMVTRLVCAAGIDVVEEPPLQPEPAAENAVPAAKA